MIVLYHFLIQTLLTMINTVENENYNFIGKLSMALYAQGITISLDALKQILNDNGMQYSEENNRGLGRSLAAAQHAWQKSGDPVVHHAIAHTIVGKDGKPAWQKHVE